MSKPSSFAVSRTNRGFVRVEFPTYIDPERKTRLVQEASALGSRSATPGASYLWVGKDHRLDVEEVTELIELLQIWVLTGTFLP